MPALRLSAVVVALSCAACQCAPPEGAVRVTVHFPGFRPGCLEVVARGNTGQSSPARFTRADLAGKSSVVVAVQRPPDWPSDVSLSVASFERACTDAPLEEHFAGRTFVAGKIETWDVTLEAVDADGDGFVVQGSKWAGTDCDDSEVASFPGGTERCDGTDGDCNGASGCADPACAGAGATLCTSAPSVCHVATGACLADGGCDYARLAAGAPCGSGVACNSSGQCVGGEVVCDDGLDNDGKFGADCADPNCLAQACSDATTCNFSGVCSAAGQCLQAGGVCQVPPSQCHQGPGTCAVAPDAGTCTFTVRTGQACSDGNACTTGEVCNASAQCTSGTALACNPPTSCHVALPCDGGCQFAFDAGAPCDDLNAFTFDDRCSLTAGQCTGTACSCPAVECRTAVGCLGDGGCARVDAAGACDGGTCAAGVCVPTSSFPYSPSNFAPGALSPSGVWTIESSCQAVYSTGPDAGLVSACPAQAPKLYLVDGGAGTEYALLAMSGFELKSGSSLRLVGNRPVILAVYGNVEISGPIYAQSSRDGGAGAGADPIDCLAQRGGDGGTTAAGGGGGGAGKGTNGAAGSATTNSSGGAAGLAGGAPPVPLRGGCPGGQGGFGPTGFGGRGGGALQISARGTLQCNQVVTASGAGGQRAGNPTVSTAGGGGGGSGGTILLEANYLDITSNCILTANGGGGGGGCHNNCDNATSTSGDDGSLTTNAPAIGGNKEGGQAGLGGSGGAGSTAPTAGGVATGGGGGGGGAAVGHVYLWSNQTCNYQPNLASPAPVAASNCR